MPELFVSPMHYSIDLTPSFPSVKQVGHSGPVRDVAVCSPMHIVSISHLGDCRVWRPVNLRKSRVAKYACQSAPASN